MITVWLNRFIKSGKIYANGFSYNGQGQKWRLVEDFECSPFQCTGRYSGYPIKIKKHCVSDAKTAAFLGLPVPEIQNDSKKRVYYVNQIAVCRRCYYFQFFWNWKSVSCNAWHNLRSSIFYGSRDPFPIIGGWYHLPKSEFFDPKNWELKSFTWSRGSRWHVCNPVDLLKGVRQMAKQWNQEREFIETYDPINIQSRIKLNRLRHSRISDSEREFFGMIAAASTLNQIAQNETH
jgi:hypothetical protein